MERLKDGAGMSRRAVVLSTAGAAMGMFARPAAHAARRREPGCARLLGMNIGAKNYHEPAYVEALSRLDVAILAFHPGWRGDRDGSVIARAVQQMKAANPSMMVGQYTILNESPDDPVKASASRDRIEKLDREDWWLKRADGAKVAWTRQYSAFDTNFTEWARADENGDRYPQWLARRDHRLYFGPVPAFDLWYFDNVMVRSRVPKADWRRRGEDLSNRDPEVEAAFRRGMAQHWAAARRLRPDIVLMGNTDNDLSTPEYRGKLQGAFLEGLMGKSWSLERTSGWSKMMDRYLDVHANLLAPRIVGFNVAGDPANHAQFRYAFCSCLMGDGHFSFTDERAVYSSVAWFDEYDVPLGAAVDPVQRQPWMGSVYRRRYEKAMALVNPGPEPQTLKLESGWRRFAGRQAGEVNSGTPATTLTLPPRDGILLVKHV
jgi:hypothetical protein